MINEILKRAIPSADLDKVQDYIEHLQAELKAARKQEPVNARLIEALRSIQRYGLDTLSGRADGGDDDRAWQRAAVNEMTKRARIALSAAEAQQASPVRLTDEEFHQAIECHGIPIENVEQAE